MLSDCMQTRRHMYRYKLYKQQASVNAYTFFFSNRACNIRNALPIVVIVESSSSAMFKRLLSNVDLSEFAMLC